MADCVNCGYCCSVAPCPYGEVTSPRNSACKFLTEPDHHGRRFCEKYDEIRGGRFEIFSPAFGKGCSSSLCNEVRETVIKSVLEGEPCPGTK